MSAGHALLHERVAAQQLRIEQLLRERDEFEAFAYALAHDLRSPLSAIDGFSVLLQEALEALPDPALGRARQLTARVRAGAQQLGELIEGLQALTRLSRSALQCSPVDLSELAGQVLGELRRQHPEPPIDARLEPGLWVQADRRLMRQLLDNLLGNARKFSRHSSRIHIELGRLTADASTQAAGWGGAFYVRDQGAGFDMAQAQRLFQPYQRLHDGDAFEGQGLGLAIVQRIVTRHGGRVRAESAPQQGTTIFFTLGAPEQCEPLTPTKA